MNSERYVPNIKLDSNNNDKDIEKDTLNKNNIGELPGTVVGRLQSIKELVGEVEERLDALGREKPTALKLQEMDKCKEALKELTNRLGEVLQSPQSQLLILDNQLSKANFEQSPMGRLDKLAKDILQKFGERISKKLKEPIEALRENKLLNAFQGVIKDLCSAIIAIVKNAVKTSIDNSIVIGEFAKSVKKLGEVISETITSGKFSPSSSATRSR